MAGKEHVRFTLTDNMPPPFPTERSIRAKDSLLVGLHPKNDKLLDSTVYPYLNGIVLNTSYRILNGDSTLYFKPYMAGNTGGKDTIRCQRMRTSIQFCPARQVIDHARIRKRFT